MPNRDIVVVGASSGGMQALKTLLRQLPVDFPAAVFIVWHVAPDHRSFLPEILQRVSELPVAHAADGERIETGRVYVSKPDHHLLLEESRVRVTRGPKENRFRPSVDVLFRSAAAAFGQRVIGVVLTGFLDDGASGLYAIKERGGTAIVQDPIEAEYPDMPLNALRAVKSDYTATLADMGDLLMRLTAAPLDETRLNPVSMNMQIEVKIAGEDTAIELGSLELGEKTSLTCPECRGALTEIREGFLTRFRCHTGHAFSLSSLLEEVNREIEGSLWRAVSRIEESEILMYRVRQQLENAGRNDEAELILRQSKNAARKARLVRQALVNHEVVGEENRPV
jgi:two-component system, chemotaxis family, protein-glutamate methylesterase/glutaminase